MTTAHVVPNGWTKGQPICIMGMRRSLKKTERCVEKGNFKPGQAIAIQQYWEKLPPYGQVQADTAFAIAFYNGADLDQWLDWWWSE